MHSIHYRKALRLMAREENASKAYPLLLAAMDEGDFRFGRYNPGFLYS